MIRKIMANAIASGVDAKAVSSTETDIETYKWFLGSVSVPATKKEKKK